MHPLVGDSEEIARRKRKGDRGGGRRSLGRRLVGEKGLVLHFAAGRWTSTTLAAPGGGPAALTGVAPAAGGAWATGPVFRGNVLLPWVVRLGTGHVEQVVVAGLPRTTGGITFSDVAASAGRVWLVGTYENGHDNTDDDGWLTAYRYNGRWRSYWENGVDEDDLRAVSALDAGNVWAVGRSGSAIAAEVEVILRWNGDGWASLGYRTDVIALNDVLAIGRNDAWTVGEPRTEGTPPNEIRPVIEHWDGRQWSRVAVPPRLAHTGETLAALAAFGKHDVWAAGGRTGHPDLLHWDGTHWQTEPPPPVSAPVSGLAAAPDGTLWAVGPGFVARSQCR